MNPEIPIGSRWRHHKGTVYLVVGFARDANTGELRILYRAENNPQGITPWDHLEHEWFRTEPDGSRRFTKIDE